MSEERDITLFSMKLDWYRSHCKKSSYCKKISLELACFSGGLLQSVFTCIACGAKPFVPSIEQEKILAKLE